MGVGETADFLWTPERPGLYVLRIGYDDRADVVQACGRSPRPKPQG